MFRFLVSPRFKLFLFSNVFVEYQGDYREGMPHKIANAIDCLKTHTQSKRAIIPIPFNSEGSETVRSFTCITVFYLPALSESPQAQKHKLRALSAFFIAGQLERCRADKVLS